MLYHNEGDETQNHCYGEVCKDTNKAYLSLLGFYEMSDVIIFKWYA